MAGTWCTGALTMSTTPGSYLICATPRTGSTLLCGLLRSTGVAGRPESYFRLPDESSWADRWRLARGHGGGCDYRDYVAAAVAEGSTDNGVFGARVMWRTLEEMVAKLGVVYPDRAGADLELLTAAFGRTRFVHLWREDTVAQAVSWVRAEQMHYWQQGDTAAPGRDPYFDPEQIRSMVQTIAENNAAWRDWFTRIGVWPYQVRYEALAADMAGVTRGILNFLGLKLPRGRRIVPGHRRQADGINEEWIARYRGMGPVSVSGPPG